MGETKYTPTPWVFGNTAGDKKLILGGTSERYICSVQIWQTPRRMGFIDEPEREANAKLILAAPDLLKACKQTLMVEKNREYKNQAIIYTLTQAIKKAEGNNQPHIT